MIRIRFHVAKLRSTDDKRPVIKIQPDEIWGVTTPYSSLDEASKNESLEEHLSSYLPEELFHVLFCRVTRVIQHDVLVPKFYFGPQFIKTSEAVRGLNSRGEKSDQFGFELLSFLEVLRDRFLQLSLIGELSLDGILADSNKDCRHQNITV